MNLDNIVEPVDKTFQTSSDSEIISFEKKYNIKFPEEYKMFLEKYGRCMFTGEATIETECKSTTEVFTMYGISCDAGHIGADLDSHPDYKENGFIPIADDMFNNRYVIDSKDGRILFLNYLNAECTIKIAANSFSKFLQKIIIQPDD
ncbi:MAG: SMI1/KNR4 family protein [Kangiellaceae bacterium]